MRIAGSAASGKVTEPIFRLPRLPDIRGGDFTDLRIDCFTPSAPVTEVRIRSALSGSLVRPGFEINHGIQNPPTKFPKPRTTTDDPLFLERAGREVQKLRCLIVVQKYALGWHHRFVELDVRRWRHAGTVT